MGGIRADPAKTRLFPTRIGHGEGCARDRRSYRTAAQSVPQYCRVSRCHRRGSGVSPRTTRPRASQAWGGAKPEAAAIRHHAARHPDHVTRPERVGCWLSLPGRPALFAAPTSPDQEWIRKAVQPSAPNSIPNGPPRNHGTHSLLRDRLALRLAAHPGSQGSTRPDRDHPPTLALSEVRWNRRAGRPSGATPSHGQHLPTAPELLLGAGSVPHRRIRTDPVQPFSHPGMTPSRNDTSSSSPGTHWK